MSNSRRLRRAIGPKLKPDELGLRCACGTWTVVKLPAPAAELIADGGVTVVADCDSCGAPLELELKP